LKNEIDSKKEKTCFRECRTLAGKASDEKADQAHRGKDPGGEMGGGVAAMGQQLRDEKVKGNHAAGKTCKGGGTSEKDAEPREKGAVTKEWK